MTINMYVETGTNPATVVDDGNMVIRNWKEDGFEISACILPDGNWVYFNKEHLALGCGWVVIHGGIAIDQSDIGVEGASFVAADGIVPTYQNTKLVVRAIEDAAWLCVTSHKPENISIELVHITDQARLHLEVASYSLIPICPTAALLCLSTSTFAQAEQIR